MLNCVFGASSGFSAGADKFRCALSIATPFKTHRLPKTSAPENMNSATDTYNASATGYEQFMQVRFEKVTNSDNAKVPSRHDVMEPWRDVISWQQPWRGPARPQVRPSDDVTEDECTVAQRVDTVQLADVVQRGDADRCRDAVQRDKALTTWPRITSGGWGAFVTSTPVTIPVTNSYVILVHPTSSTKYVTKTSPMSQRSWGTTITSVITSGRHHKWTSSARPVDGFNRHGLDDMAFPVQVTWRAWWRTNHTACWPRQPRSRGGNIDIDLDADLDAVPDVDPE